MKKVVLGLSGGVDSAVAAKLLQKNCDVHGLYLDIGQPGGAEEARAAAEALGVPLTVRDIRCTLETQVCAPFAEAYARGETPNPCILCNPAVKFRLLCAHADALGAEYIATGHYACTENGGLYRGHPNNDQSYMLCRLTREQVSRLLLPLGDMEKPAVRALAQEMGLAVATKPDSMEICFIPDKDYVGYLARRGVTPPAGNFVFNGEVIGRHEGIHRWTVGQRLPGLYKERKLYIASLDAGTNEIQLALWEDLFKIEVLARDMNWLIDAPTSPIRARVRVRHTKWEMPQCTVTPLPNGSVHILCDEPVRAPAPGQAAALYAENQLLGGGIIAEK